MLKRALKGICRKMLNKSGFDVVRAQTGIAGLKRLKIASIIDVGANKGQFAKTAVSVFPQADLYCFEPLPVPFAELSQWAEKQGKGKVTVFNAAVGEKEGEVEMYNHLDFSPSSSLLKTAPLCGDLYPFTKNSKLVTVKSTTLDAALLDSMDSISLDILIKIDVQGYEDRVLKGATDILKKAKACILEVNLDLLYEDQCSFKDVSTILNELNYAYAGNLQQYHADDGHVISMDCLFINKGQVL